MGSVEEILEKPVFLKNDIVYLLNSGGQERLKLFEKAKNVKVSCVGNKVYLRGLIEYSNRCLKNCYYCGIRTGNKQFARYRMSDQEVLEAAGFAFRNDYASIVIQSGEQTSKTFIVKIESLLKKIHRQTSGKIHVTLSLGEQSEETYRRWFDAGAHRYLLRIEVSNPYLYRELHPNDAVHDFRRRLGALRTLREVGYQVGTGVMIGLPFQTVSDLADDLVFFGEADVDMVGMGPYIEHAGTPMYRMRDKLLPLTARFDLALKMIAVLRIMMHNINIAATTAMQTIDPDGREKALSAGANVIMPNLTPVKYRQDYLLYENKPCLNEDAWESKINLEARIRMAGDVIGYGEWGDSQHYRKRVQND